MKNLITTAPRYANGWVKRLSTTQADFKLIALLAPLLTVCANPSMAQDLDPLSDMLDNVIDALTGGVGRGIAILAVVVIGYMGFVGRMDWTRAMMVCAGIVLVFSAATIVDGFATTT